jgi:hypothetical protein
MGSERDRMKDRMIKALLDQSRYYGLLSKRAARAAKRASGAQKEILEERAKRLLNISQYYFQKACVLKGKEADDEERR